MWQFFAPLFFSSRFFSSGTPPMKKMDGFNGKKPDVSVFPA